MRYRVSGTDGSSNEEVELVVTADDVEAAMADARRRGITPTGVSPVNEGAAPAGAGQASGGFSGQRAVLAIAAGAGMLGTFLPWAHAPIVGSVAGTAGDGWITFALFAVALLLAVTGNLSRPTTDNRSGFILVMGVLSGGVGIWKISDISQIAGDMQSSDNPFTSAFSAGFQVGSGLYLIAAAAIVLFIGALFGEKAKKKTKG